MSLQVKRLSLGAMGVGMGAEWPVHGFLVTYPGGAVLVDTGVGGPDQVLADSGVVNRSVADALDEHDMTPGDIGLVINTHLHFDHCGQNAVFKHAPFYIQRAELERARRESPQLAGWFGRFTWHPMTSCRRARQAIRLRGASRSAVSRHCGPTECTSAMTPE
jgi:glyoxylase-like metal-dependent hydrolase (beta-lactamase superfamily II)